MNKNLNLRPSLIVAFIALAGLSRLLPHPYNFTPIGGMALFGAAYFCRKYLALIVPFVALWISNLLLDNLIYAQYYEGFVWVSNPAVFIAFALIVLVGWGLLKKVTLGRLLGSSLSASAIFFIVSNFGSWLDSGIYPRTWDGLVACYVAAVPFFQNTLAGDLFYVAVLFGSYELVRRTWPKLALHKAADQA